MRNSLWIIKGVNILSGMSAENQEKIASASRVDRFPRGQIFSFPNAPAHSVYYLNEGRMRYVRLLPENREGVSLDIVRGEVFGRVPGGEDQPFPFFLEALEDIEIRVLSRADFQSLVVDGMQNLVFRAYLPRGLLRTKIENAIWSLLYKDVPDRIAALLMALGGNFGKESGGRLLLGVKLSPQSLAHLTGTSPDIVLLTLAGFVHRRYIEIRKGKFTLKNKEALRALAGRSGGMTGRPMV